jgi:hypothetical protein
MIMKKLIAIAVVFALAAGMVFAADIGANVIGTVNLFGSNTGTGSTIQGSANFNRLRLEGSGENGDGNFGAWLRLEIDGGMFQGVDEDTTPFLSGLAWWKPIDQIKLTIGGNPDGIFGKEGFAGWMFRQTANDTGVVTGDDAWGCDYTVGGPPWGHVKIPTPYSDDGLKGIHAFGAAVFRNAFYGGTGGPGLLLEIKPVDMIGLNVILPYFGGGLVKGIFQHMTVQVDVNLDFGNIALTYELIDNAMNPGKIGQKAYLYFGLSAIENLSLDVGIGFRFPENDGYVLKTTRNYPMSIGVAAKYNISDSFGLKARVLAELAGSAKTVGYVAYKDPLQLIFQVLPFFSINDSVTIFADIGLNIVGQSKYDGNKLADSGFGWHFNPYVQIGNEWGPSFFAGIKLWSTPTWGADVAGFVTPTNKAIINWSVPIALNVSF